jgi:hypothetical protein
MRSCLTHSKCPQQLVLAMLAVTVLSVLVDLMLKPAIRGCRVNAGL